MNFIPPTLQEVEQLIQEKGYSVDAAVFFYFYDSNGWMVGKTKMKKWRSALAGWNCRDKKAVSRKTKLFPIKGKCCGKQGCPLPAVLKINTGGYDHYTCGPHMPEKVKELYTW